MDSIIVENISKTYGSKKSSVTALEAIDFKVAKGELFGVIGPDGAGKTSLFRILTTLLLPDTGRAWVDGYDIVKDYKSIRQSVGYMPGRFSLYQDLSVEENLEFFATIFNTTIKENYELIKDIYVQIEPFKTRKAGKLSGGTKQKLALSCALIHRPSVLFLDEPTTGVDAVSRKEFWAMLKGLQKKGITILVSTPYMDEAALCDRVALLQNGKVLTIDSPTAIEQAFGKKLLGARATNMLQLLNELRSQPEVERAYPSGIYHNIVLRKEEIAYDLESRLLLGNHPGLELVDVKPTIEDCFMDLMV
jgi:ABC-2 type transport system ATP-binding protein